MCGSNCKQFMDGILRDVELVLNEMAEAVSHHSGSVNCMDPPGDPAKIRQGSIWGVCRGKWSCPD